MAVIGDIALSLDGRVTGPGGPRDMSWIVRHATTPLRLIAGATTALMGRMTYEGFAAADPIDREFSRWLNSVRKMVISRTLTGTPWSNTRITADDPAAVVKRLRDEDGDVLVLASASIIRELLAVGELDRLSITLCPELVGGGARLFDDAPAGSSWSLADATPTPSGAICLVYDRRRP
jgi:dihydrofolate reductase